MIYLSTTTPKKVIVQSNKDQAPDNTLEDLTTDYYTFKLINCASFKEYIFSPKNFSQSPYYDAFTISVGSTTSATGSSVMMNFEVGQYNYELYKMPTEYNLNIASASYIVSSGIVQIISPDTIFASPQPITFTQSDDATIRVFNEL
jgi:hypothetical protein